jgi:hypothetical protein
MLAAPTLSWPPLPTPPPFHPGLYRRLCARIVHLRGVNSSLWTSLAIKIWWSYGLKWSLPPPPRWPSHLMSLASDRGLNRQICASIVHISAVNLSLWTSLAIMIWWSYGMMYLRPPTRTAQCYLSANRQSGLCGPFLKRHHPCFDVD